MLAAGTAYLHSVGPAYGPFGLGFALYFASQGAGRLLWPVVAGFARLLIAVGGGWIALASMRSLGWVFVALSAALVTYGLLLSAAVASGAWFKPARGGRSLPMRLGRSHPPGDMHMTNSVARQIVLAARPRRKGRKQTCPTYRRRATSPLHP